MGEKRVGGKRVGGVRGAGDSRGPRTCEILWMLCSANGNSCMSSCTSTMTSSPSRSSTGKFASAFVLFVLVNAPVFLYSGTRKHPYPFEELCRQVFRQAHKLKFDKHFKPIPQRALGDETADKGQSFEDAMSDADVFAFLSDEVVDAIGTHAQVQLEREREKVSE